MADPLTVSFEIKVGDVWVDSDNIAWYVKSYDAFKVYLERTVVDEVRPKSLVQNFREVEN